MKFTLDQPFTPKHKMQAGLERKHDVSAAEGNTQLSFKSCLCTNDPNDFGGTGFEFPNIDFSTLRHKRESRCI